MYVVVPFSTPACNTGASRVTLLRLAIRLEIDLVALDPAVDLHAGLAHRSGDIRHATPVKLEELDQLAEHGTRSVESALAERRRA